MEGDTYGDKGYILTQELRAPPVKPSQWIDLAGINDTLLVYLFHDYGFSKNIDLLPEERRRTTLQSIGFGIQYYVGRYFSMRFDYGWRHRETVKSDKGSRGHIAATISY